MAKSKHVFWLRQQFSKISIRIIAFCLLSIFTALIAVIFRPFVADAPRIALAEEAIEPILTILASSMLSVSTFSLGIMVSAIATAAQSSSPRATQLLLRDRTSQNVVATFLGAFLFCLIALISLRLGLYHEGGRMILMAVTLAVIVIIFVSFTRWIELLRLFGRINDTLDRVETATIRAFDYHSERPLLGCNAFPEKLLEKNKQFSINAKTPCYVQHIDLPALQKVAGANDLNLFIARTPGEFVTVENPLVWVNQVIDDDVRDRIRSAFTTGNERNFSQDPRFGMIIMAETASRALSPAVNDPGTAVDILRRGHRVLSGWQSPEESEVEYPNLWVTPLAIGDVFKDFFRPIARDGAGVIEVQTVLQKTLVNLAEEKGGTFIKAAKHQSEDALKRSDKSDLLQSEKDYLHEIARSCSAKVGAVLRPEHDPKQ